MAEIIFDPVGSVENLEKHLNSLTSQEGTVMILSCDDNAFCKEDIDPILQKSPLPLLGIIVPSIIYNTEKYDKGTLLIRQTDIMDIHIIRDISQKDYDVIDEDMETQMNDFSDEIKTMFVYVDGLSKNIGVCVDVLFDNYGLDINYIGGGAGSLSFSQKPSLFTNEGLLMDAFVYAYSKCYSSIGVSHGWRSISGPYQVTKSVGTKILEIDHKPAFDVYKEVVDKHSDAPITAENFFDIAKSFPFGINTITDEKIVRDPIVLEGSSLVCVGTVTQGSYVDILYGKNEYLIKAASQASQISSEGLDFKSDFMIFIDCISRVLFLNESFEDEIRSVYQPGIPLVGALTFGEIANNGRDYLAFYNKTSVVGYIGHGQ